MEARDLQHEIKLYPNAACIMGITNKLMKYIAMLVLGMEPISSNELQIIKHVEV